ncbi:unnamed protein product, partial [Strongylus vulgaris]
MDVNLKFDSEVRAQESRPADPDKTEKKRAEAHASSRPGISSRIHKRKMPVRRPTAYVSDKNSND